MKVGADAHENPAWCGRREETGIDAIPATLKSIGTIRMGQEIATIESIHINSESRWLQTQDKMAWHTHTGHRKTQTTRNKQINEAKADRIA